MNSEKSNAGAPGRRARRGERLGHRLRRIVVTTIAAAALVPVTSLGVVSAESGVTPQAIETPATAVPGLALLPQVPPPPPAAPIELYLEDFENGSGTTELEDYLSDSGATYTAAPYWLLHQRCNGFIVSHSMPNTLPSSAYCNNGVTNWNGVRRMAYAIGLLTGTPTTNRALSTYTAGGCDNTDPCPGGGGPIDPPGANQIMFATAGQLTMPTANRFVTFSVDTAATTCFQVNNQPLLRFYLRTDAGVEIPVSSSAINACTQGTATTVEGQAATYGSFAANGSTLLAGTSLGVVLRNEQLQTNGNDSAIDNIRVLDVTPQLHKEFDPELVVVGGISTLTITIVNTSELASKYGWSFTDTLPADLVLADPAGATTTCPSDPLGNPSTVTATAGGNVIEVSGNLAVGMASCTVTVNVTSDVVGEYTNGPGEVGDLVGLNPPNTAVVEFADADIEVVKTAGAIVDVNGNDMDDVGDTITYTFVVTNIGDVPLNDVVVTDPLPGLSALDCTPAQPATLAPFGQPGDSMTCTAVYTLTQDDVQAGEVENTATVTGTPVGTDEPITDDDDETVPVTQEPGISLVKTADVAEFTAAGETIVYSFVVTNTGNVTLTEVTVTDDLVGAAIVCAPVANGSIVLLPGESVTCTAEYTTTDADVLAGGVLNVASVTGDDDGDPETPGPEDEDEVETPLDPQPGIELVKTADPVTFTAAGETITYSFVVTNTGNVTLTDVLVEDALIDGPVVCGDPNVNGSITLLPGESTADLAIECTATYETTYADVLAGSVTNAASVTGDDDGDPETPGPEDEDEVETPLDPQPGIELEKTANSETFTGPGETIVYSFVVTNTGNVTLTEVTVTDDLVGAAIVCAPTPNGSIVLLPGESVTCTAQYQTTDADVENGGVTNVASVTGDDDGDPETPGPEDEDEVETPFEPLPGLSVVKTAGIQQFTTVGQTIYYEFLVTNTGNVPISNIVIVDDQIDAPAVCGGTELLPQQYMTCVGSHAVTQDDLDAGVVVNVASATGEDPDGGSVESEEDTETVTGPAAGPALGVVKSSTWTVYNVAGDVVPYTFVVTNSGNVTVSNLIVEDDMLDAPAICEDTTLLPGASTECVGQRTVTDADVAAGSILNAAIVSGTSPGGPVESPEDTWLVVVNPCPEPMSTTTVVTEDPAVATTTTEVDESSEATSTTEASVPSEVTTTSEVGSSDETTTTDAAEPSTSAATVPSNPDDGGDGDGQVGPQGFARRQVPRAPVYDDSCMIATTTTTTTLVPVTSVPRPVVPPGPIAPSGGGGGQLPATGSSSEPLIAAAGVLLAAGLGLIVFTQRKRRDMEMVDDRR